jgi:hypothetical protein
MVYCQESHGIRIIDAFLDYQLQNPERSIVRLFKVLDVCRG